MNLYNYMITYLFFVTAPSLGIALLDHIIFGLVAAISNIRNPFVPKSRVIDLDTNKLHKVNNRAKFAQYVQDQVGDDVWGDL